jgi:hypothetical protein
MPEKRWSFSPKIPQSLVFLFQKDLQAVQITLVISATLQIGKQAYRAKLSNIPKTRTANSRNNFIGLGYSQFQ